MDRKEYLIKCREYHIDGKEKVMYRGTEYHPDARICTFSKLGEPLFSARLKSISTNSIIICKIEDVEGSK